MSKTSRAVAYYDNIYLVATQEERTSRHRVSEREPGKRPATISFSGNHVSEVPDVTYGTLVLNDALWEEWFGDRKMLDHMATAEIAAETLVSQYVNIYYGCPLCTFRGKDKEEADAHIHTHINKFVQQFRLEIEEVPDNDEIE